MRIAVVHYNAGNIGSVMRALKRLGHEAVLTDDERTILAARHVIFPGVGHAAAAMGHLRKCGLESTLRRVTAPLLGICLGMQLLFERSEEGSTECLGVIPGAIDRFSVRQKVPHVGWNSVMDSRGELMNEIREGEFFYFVHGYKAPIGPYTRGITEYETAFSSVVQNGNFYGVQFHPEKSGEAGERLLKNFLALK